jgi:hypothetical protein
MTEPLAGIKVMTLPSRPGIGVMPAVPFSATRAERARAEKEASKAALLLRRPSPGQLALLRHLAESSPDGSYIVTSSKWIEAILKATKGLSEADMNCLHAFDWTERVVPANDLRRELLAVLKQKPPDR